MIIYLRLFNTFRYNPISSYAIHSISFKIIITILIYYHHSYRTNSNDWNIKKKNKKILQLEFYKINDNIDFDMGFTSVKIL